MSRKPSQPTHSPPPPLAGVKASTHALLLDTAMALIRQDGHVPSVAEVAARSQVSRATAYRYFPSRSALIAAVMDASLGPAVRAFESNTEDPHARLRELFVQTFPRFAEFEPQMRAAAQLSLEQWALERAGLLEEEPYRRGHRVRILQHALLPLEGVLPPAVFKRLHHALSVVYGIEPHVILKDIWGLDNRAVERVALWMADAMLAAALRDAGQPAVLKKRAATKNIAAPAVFQGARGQKTSKPAAARRAPAVKTPRA